MVKTILKVILPLLVIAGAAYGAREIIKNAPQPKPREKVEKLPVVRVVRAVRETIRLEVLTYGAVYPRTEVQVMPQVPGKVVFVSPNLRKGGFFKVDEPLLKIEQEDYKLAKTQAEAVVAQAQARLDREEAEAAVALREWQEYGKGKASPLVLREPQVKEAQAQLASAKAMLLKAGLDFGRTEIKAPYNGRVLSENVDVGQFITAGMPVARIFATDFAEVRLAIPDDQLAFVDLPLDRSVPEEKAGAGNGKGPEFPVALTTTYAGRKYSWPGHIVRSEPEVDPKTRVIHVIARVEKPFEIREPGQPPLMVGMYLEAKIPGRTIDNLIALPRSALFGRDKVLVVDEENRIRRRTVTILRREKGRLLLTGGIEDGERICMTKLDPVVEKMRVEVEGER